jgi:hypothetical protein
MDFLFVIETLDASVERKVSTTSHKTNDSVGNVFNTELHCLQFIAVPQSSTEFKVQRGRLFANEIQTGLKPGPFWPRPLLLRQRVFLVIPVVNRTLHEDRLPSVHVKLLLILLLDAGQSETDAANEASESGSD